MEEVILNSLAKINLGLEVLGLREDGYHEIITLFQTVDLRDRLVFRLRADGQIFVSGDRTDLPWDESNLIYRAALLLKNESGSPKGVEIEVNKNIPPGRGLAGGSSNAALTILVLNRLWQLNLSVERLLFLAASLGADIPYFFYGGLCLGRGKGEKLDPLPDLPQCWVLLVIPDFPVSTAMVYRELDRQEEFLTSRDKASKIIQFSEAKDISLIRHLENDLELVTFKIYPQLAEIKQEMANSGAELSMMSGSGSAVYGLFTDRSQAQQAVDRFQTRYQVFLVETVGRELYRRKLITGASPNW
ncbi:MAG: 4-(cytidine 5'-diphospho)-2-C-methyl-D-erythritol kinase [Candidatus Aminicenantes bacterium]|nr:4-(cytidine 5'-diphospho)-2-C-methyl-D-erythritol kinase [Candidatus Aminicenantes bacterium]